MDYRVVEQRPDQHATDIEVGGRTYPVPSIVEDEDGLRLLLTKAFWVTVDTWTWAHRSGAVALVNVEAMKFALTSTFSDERTENPRMDALVLAESFWHPYEPGMTYIEMAAAGGEPMHMAADNLQAATEGVFNHEDVEEAAMAAHGVGEEDLPDLGQFVHLHTHSEFSALDGLTTIDQMMKVITGDGQRAVALTDHGVCAGHPELQIAADRAGIKPIFGMEANFITDRHVKDAETLGLYQHLVLWAMTDEGLRNLWAMSTEGFAEDSFYARPRIDWDTLERLNEGVMCSTACLRGPLARPYLEGDEATALANLARLKEIFGDRLYIELGTNQLADQIKVNEWASKIAEEQSISTVAVVDSHYAEACDKHTHQVWLAVQTNSDIADETGMFGGDQDYHLMTAAEVEKALSYLPAHVVTDSMRNTVRVARRCTAKIETKDNLPVYSKPTQEWPDPVAHDVDRLISMVQERWAQRVPANGDQDEYFARAERELKMIIDKGFCGYFLQMAEVINWAKDNGILVGPGRGSGGGSLVAYAIRITETDPVEHDLLFERFMTEGRNALPDFDVDIPSSKKQMVFDMLRERWGVECVAIVGTHMRVKSKGVINDVARALKSTLPDDYYIDLQKVSEIIKEAEIATAGLGLPWDELWIQHGDQLAPYREKYPEVFALADELYGRLKTYGTHPAGVIISTDGPILDQLPLRRGGEDAPMVAQFDFRSLEAMGFVKFDFLNLRTLDTLQLCVDLIEQTTGERVDIYSWTHDQQYSDPQLYDELSAGWTLGVFQAETTSMTRLITQLRPDTVAKLADAITLVRPGPTRSGLTKLYLLRREGQEPIHVPDQRLEEVLAKTLGCMVYQEDIMQICMVLAGYDGTEADEVRKILGKKKVELVGPAGEQFVARAVENGTDRAVAEALWEQMAEFARYSFNRAHAFSYAILGIWTAWFKFHYPVQFLCAALSTVKQERIAEFVEEARRMGYFIQPPDINSSESGFTATAMAVRYGFLSISGIGEVACDAILAGQPYKSWEDFRERVSTKCNSGHIRKLARIGAFDSLVPNRRYLELLLEMDEIKGSDLCLWKQDEPVLITGQLTVGEPPEPETVTLPCTYDWPQEPREPSKQAGRFRKAKPLPKKCTRACRRYNPMPPPAVDEIEPYTDEDIRRIEIEALGVFLSSTPFDRIPEQDRADCLTGQEVMVAEPGSYIVAGLVRTVRRHTDINGNEMAFIKLATERGELEVTVFKDQFSAHRQALTSGRLVLAAVRKDARGVQLLDLVDLDS